MRLFFLCAALALLPGARGAGFPEAEISNGTVTAKIYLPNYERGYYRATRFDWSGQIYSLKTLGREFFGQWFPRYDPKLHDSIMGPVEAFHSGESAVGFDEAKPGEIFYRIGVGGLRKPDNQPFNTFRTYDIINPGKWIVRPSASSIEFIHELKSDSGYGWEYKKVIRLVKNRPEMVIEHTLKNTGKKPLVVQQFNHNFFVIDNKPTGPGVAVQFPFALKAKEPFKDGAAEVEGNQIHHREELKDGQSVFGQFEGGTPYEMELRHASAGVGVRITGDRPIERLVYWSIRSTFCPEAYVDVTTAPGKTTRWRYTYTFFELSQDHGKSSGASSR